MSAGAPLPPVRPKPRPRLRRHGRGVSPSAQQNKKSLAQQRDAALSTAHAKRERKALHRLRALRRGGLRLMKKPRALAAKMGDFGPILPATRSGRATLVRLDDADARVVSSGDLLLTPWHGGRLLVLEVQKARESAHSDGDGSPVAVPVVDVRPLPLNGAAPARDRLTFAPDDLLQVSVRRGKVPA